MNTTKYGQQGYFKHPIKNSYIGIRGVKSQTWRIWELVIDARVMVVTYWPARLPFLDKNGEHEFIPSKNEHTEECKANSGIKPENVVWLENESNNKIKDIGADFKKDALIWH